MSPLNGTAEGAKCKDLEKIIVGDDPEVFSSRGLAASSGEGRADRVSQKER